MALWKDTFHDSDEYITLFFDKYFTPELVEYEVSGPEVVGALVGVPYEFGGGDNRVRGLYLCGLCTKPRYRGQGIMTRLLENINRRAADMGYAFTFLIPASARLRCFYADRGYVDAFHRCQLNYTSLHDFKLEYDMILEAQKEKVADLKRRYYASLEGHVLDENTPAEVREQIINMILMEEGGQLDMEILHTRQDIETIIAENGVSGGKIYYVSSTQGPVTAVAFTSLVDRSRIDIHRLYSSDLCSRYRLLDFIKRDETDAGIRLYVAPYESERKNLAEMYGMAHVLNLREILKFQAEGHGDLKYSILVNRVNDDAIDRYDVRGGKVKHQVIDKWEDLGMQRAVISPRDIASVLFRRPDTGALITEAFGMPSLGGFISLMLD